LLLLDGIAKSITDTLPRL